MPSDSAKRYAPATLRNREPIRDVLRDVLPEGGQVLEIGSGSGEHALYFAASFPEIIWQPTDAGPECLESITAWMAEASLPNLRPPLRLDVLERPWAIVADQLFDAVVSINMIHIAPWEACRGLMAGATRVLRRGGVLYLYGPFMIDGRHTAPSNAAFDESLKEMDPRFGVREIAAVSTEAGLNGLMLEEQVPMPANNFSLIFRCQSGPKGG